MVAALDPALGGPDAAAVTTAAAALLALAGAVLARRGRRKPVRVRADRSPNRR